MPIRSQKQYRYQSPAIHQTKTFQDFSMGLDTASTETNALLTVANNVRLNGKSLFDKRSGTHQKGNIIGTSAKINGIHSYVTKNQTARLLASYNTDIYNYSETNTPSTIATSSNAQGIGYSKDRHVFMTTAHTDSTNLLPFCVVIYQNGSGIQLEWEDTPYNGWTNTVIQVTNTATGLGFDCFMDSSDNIHVAFEKDNHDLCYVKLTYGSGPTWSVGTIRTIQAVSIESNFKGPSVFVQNSGRVHVSFTDFAADSGGYYFPYAYYSDDNFVTSIAVGHNFASEYGAVNSTNLSTKMLGNSDTPTMIVQNFQDGITYYYYTHSWTGTDWASRTLNASSSAGTLHAYTGVFTGGTLDLQIGGVTSSGLSTTAFSSLTNAQLRRWSVVNDGVNDNDIQYKNVINGVPDATATRVTNDSNNNKFPSTPEFVSATAAFTPVVFMVGTSNPYSIKVNSATQWTALSASLTAGSTVNSCVMPFTAAGGTDQIYFVNGADTPKKWDGTTLASATATGYPVASWIFAMDDRLWMGGETGKENYLRYTALGSDSFTGTFPTGNIIGLPEGVLWGHWYRDSTAIFFTRQSLYIVQNYDYSGVAIGPEAVRKIPDSYGILSGRTVKQINGWIYYQRPDGQIMRTNTQWAECVSEKIAPTLYDLSLSQLQSAAAGSLGFYYYLAVTSSGAGKNDTMIVLDTRKSGPGDTGGGYTIDTGKNCSCLVTHPDQNGVPQLFYGESTISLGVVYQMETGTSDNGSAIDMDLQTGILPLSGLYLNDQLRDILVMAEATGDYDVTVGIAKATSTNSFTNFTVNTNPNAGVWGVGVWDVSRMWGGSTNISTVISGINIISNGHKLRFRNNAVDQQINIISFVLTHEPFKDRT